MRPSSINATVPPWELPLEGSKSYSHVPGVGLVVTAVNGQEIPDAEHKAYVQNDVMSGGYISFNANTTPLVNQFNQDLATGVNPYAARQKLFDALIALDDQGVKVFRTDPPNHVIGTGLLRYSQFLGRLRFLRSSMPRKSPFKHHRFPREIILCAVRWYLRYPLSYQDVADLLEERGIMVDRSTVYRWVQKFGPELTKRTEKHLRRASVDWHVDETYIRVGGKWRYLWRAVDANGQMIDFRLTARRDAKAAKAFLNKAIERVRLHRPVTIVTDKAPTYRRVIREINCRYDPHFDSIRHIDKKWRNNLIESDHAAMKRILGYRQSFRSLRSAKATLSGLETIRTIKRGHIHHKHPGVTGEIAFIDGLFDRAAT